MNAVEYLRRPKISDVETLFGYNETEEPLVYLKSFQTAISSDLTRRRIESDRSHKVGGRSGGRC